MSGDAPDETLEESAKRALRDDPSDALSRAVARSKIAAKLFARHEPVKVGRYHLLEQVGAGGMGVVWGAWDPELDRRVAIKVVKPHLAAARERIVREGQALAKLSHPHVVPVYDVGVVDEQVYLVMEWVRGQTLRGWIGEPRATKNIIRAYREAALGLAAAHEAGLVHRDFKPDNAMIGTADSRVRVLDFGLARAGEDATTIGGTPRYMAPEQRTSATVTAAVDQYALGIALGEALPSPPKWIAEIIARATADKPDDRFPSMIALADALGRDPARVLRRRLAVAGALGLAGATFAIGMKARGNEAEHCVGADAEIATAWNPELAATMRTHLVALGPYGTQVADRASTALDAYAKQWAATHRAACLAHDRGELTPELYTTNLACLVRAKTSLTTARDVLDTTTLEHAHAALAAVQSLPAVERCRTETEDPPPANVADQVAANANAVARARMFAIAVDPRAIDAAAQAAKEADAIGYPRQIGRAALVHGLALLTQFERISALPVLAHAAEAALEAGDNATAIEALARRLYAIGTGSETMAQAEAALATLDLAMPIAKGLTGDGAFARALLYNNLGTLYYARQKRELARTWFLEAEHVRPHAAGMYELASIASNLALVETNSTARDGAFERANAELAAALGEDHPMTLDARFKAAMFSDDASRALLQMRDVLERYRRLHAHVVEQVTQYGYEVLWLAEARGDMTTAATALEPITKGVLQQLAGGYRALFAGKYAEVERDMTKLADELTASAHFFVRWRAVDAWLLSALAADRAGDHAAARTYAERGLSALDALGEFAEAPYVQRRRARIVALTAGSRPAEGSSRTGSE